MRAAAIVLALVAACGSSDRGPRYRAAGATTPQRGGTLRWSMVQQVRTLDPAIAYDEITAYFTHALFDTLVGYEGADPDQPGSGLTIVPHLAEAWTISDDHLVYTFTLRPGIAFSDGQPVVAGDFVYGLERVLTTSDSPYPAFLDDIAGAKDLVAGKAKTCAGLRAIDDRHLEIRLTRPYAGFLYLLAMSFTTPQKRAWVEGAGDQLRRRVLGTGPWILTAWDEGQRLELARNPRYWDRSRPLLDGQVILENIPRDTAFLMFEAGDLDVVDRLPGPVYTWIQTRDDWRPFVHASSAMNVYGERMNVTRKPFDDVRVRRAMNYALNKDHVVRLLAGGATPAHGLLPPGLFGRDATLTPYPYDPDRARALLAEAGYPDGFDIEYVTIKDDDSEKLAASMQADLARVGVRMKVTLMSFATYLSAVGRPDGPSFSYSAWFADFPDPSNFIDTRFHSRQIAKENSNNDSFYANPALDTLIDAARLEGDPTRRAAMYRQIERVLYDDAPWIWSYHRKFVEVTQPYVRGYQPHPVWVRAYEDAWLDLGPEGQRLAREAP